MKFIEHYISYILGLTIAFVLFKFTSITYKESVEFIKQFTTIGTCTFGFLLTLFSLIIQGDNQAINKMRKRHKPFLRFIAINKKIVIFSFLLTVYAYLVGYIDITTIVNNCSVIKLIICLFYGGFACFILKTIYFLAIFYLLIQGKKENKNDRVQ
jgi:hypothetical protein